MLTQIVGNCKISMVRIFGIYLLGMTLGCCMPRKLDNKGSEYACDHSNPLSCQENEYCVYVNGKGVCKSLPKSPNMVFHLPFPSDRKLYCAQGNLNPDHESSHTNTEKNSYCHFAFDFATPANEPPTLVLASAGGIAYTYGGCQTKDILKQNVDNCNLGFGNMVKIDHGNGYYTLYAHLSAIAVRNGEYVRTGDIIGIEGNTGKAGGKHIHWSLHKGKASKKEMSPSVPMENILAIDVTEGEKTAKIKRWSDFVCGQRSFNNAHRYTSDNSTNFNVGPTYGLPNEKSCYYAFFGLGPEICVESSVIKAIFDFLSY